MLVGRVWSDDVVTWWDLSLAALQFWSLWQMIK